MKAKTLTSPLGLSAWDFAPPFQDKATIEGIDIFLAGGQATHPKFGEVVGSSASLSNFPDSSARFELMERIAIVESLAKPSFPLRHESSETIIGEVSVQELFPDTQADDSRFAKSNGVALYSSWQEACRRAALEMVERHLILASWLGFRKPVKMEGVAKSPLQALQTLYRVEHYDFGRQKVSTSAGAIYVTAVVLKPLHAASPFIMGCGAGQSQAESIHKAEAEAWQRLGFLWGEEIPVLDPEFAPHQLYHQEYYLYPQNHSLIDAWLRGDFFSETAKKSSLPEILVTRFADLSIPGAPDFRVAKALAPDAIPLVFGRYREGLFAELEENRLIHPIA